MSVKAPRGAAGSELIVQGRPVKNVVLPQQKHLPNGDENQQPSRADFFLGQKHGDYHQNESELLTNNESDRLSC
jgi:hypothetical protein